MTNFIYRGVPVTFVPREISRMAITHSVYENNKEKLDSLGFAVKNISKSDTLSTPTEREIEQVFLRYVINNSVNFTLASPAHIKMMFSNRHNLYFYNKPTRTIHTIQQFDSQCTEKEIEWFLENVVLENILVLELTTATPIQRLSNNLHAIDIKHKISGDQLFIDQWLTAAQLTEIAKISKTVGYV